MFMLHDASTVPSSVTSPAEASAKALPPLNVTLAALPNVSLATLKTPTAGPLACVATRKPMPASTPVPAGRTTAPIICPVAVSTTMLPVMLGMPNPACP